MTSEKFAGKVKVFGAGSGGNNAVDYMIASGIRGINYIFLRNQIKEVDSQKLPSRLDFININKSMERLELSYAEYCLHIGEQFNKGFSHPDLEKAKAIARESKDKIRECIQDAGIVIITAGLGGSTGTGASIITAETAKESGVYTIGLVTRPSSYESENIVEQAEQGIKELKEGVDTFITVPADGLLKILPNDTSIFQAFEIANEIIKKGTETILGITTALYEDPQLNLLAIKSIFSGDVGIGVGESDNVKDAVKNALRSPLIDCSIHNNSKIMLNITTSVQGEPNEYLKNACEYLTKHTDRENILAGMSVKEEQMSKAESVVLVKS